MKNTLVFFFACIAVNILAQGSLNLIEVGSHDTGSIDYNDVWGYEREGNQYIVYGARDKIAIVDVTDCSNPIEEAVISDGNSTIWRDFKDYGDYIYGVCDQGAEGLQIINKDDYTWTQNTDDFVRAHNIFVDKDNARLYVVGSNTENNGVIIYDLSVSPENPTLLASVDFNDFDDLSDNLYWYVHDVYVRDNIAYCSHGGIGTYGIWDFEDAANPVLLGSSTADGLGDYNHSSWVSEDLKYAYVAEEVPQKEMTILDISDVENIEFIGQFSDPLLAGASTPPRAHNPFIRADLLYISYYHDGLKVYDVSDPTHPIVEGYYDTAVGHTSYSSYTGAWGVYPYLTNGCIAVSDIVNGLHLLEHEVETTSTITDSDLYLTAPNTGLIFRKNPEEYGILKLGSMGDIVTESISSLPTNHEDLKRSNLYIDNASKGIVFSSGGKLIRIQIDNLGNLTNTIIGSSEPIPNVQIQSSNFVINSVGSSLFMKSPDGNCWRISMNDDNTIITTSGTYP